MLESVKENKRLKASIAAIHCRLCQDNIDAATIVALKDECEYAVPELKNITNADIE